MRPGAPKIPATLEVTKLDKDAEPSEDERKLEQKIMDLLDAPGLSPRREDQHQQDEEMVMLEAEGGDDVSKDMGNAIVMTNDELRMVQELSDDVKSILDKFIFREILKYEDFLHTFRQYVGDEFTEVHILQFLEYRRLENPPPVPSHVKHFTDDEAHVLVQELDQDFCYYLDLYNHREIYGINTIGLLIEAKIGHPVSMDSVQMILHERRKINPPTGRDQSAIVVTAGYLSHDYWPSLMCVPDGEHHCRYFNLTNTRNGGFHRYYRCSKCCTIKNVIDQNNKRTGQKEEFIVPKIQIHGDNLVTDVSSLVHHGGCKPIPMAVMLAEQLDRRARRQVSLGLMNPKEGYFEALRITDMVMAYHPNSPRSVVDLFPAYDICRGQYSRNFHKLRRRLSMPPEFDPAIDKRKPVNDEDYEGPSTSALDAKLLRKSKLRQRRGREADERFEQVVPPTLKNDLASGYVPDRRLSPHMYFYGDNDNEFYGQEAMSMGQVEQEEVVVTDENQAERLSSQGQNNGDVIIS